MNIPVILPECRYAVIGFPVAHSRSPQMQNAAFRYYGLGTPYERICVPPEALEAFTLLARRRLAGFNVTVPHKSAIIPFLDGISPLAEMSGSVNTVTVMDGKLFGDSTDGYGLETALREAFGRVAGHGIFAFLGTGGAARAAAFYLAREGALEFVLINRTPEKAAALRQDLLRYFPKLRTSLWEPSDPGLGDALAACEVTIQATSLGLKPDDPLPAPEAALCRARAIFDTIYGHTPTERLALQYDIPCATGEAMLLHQGAKSFEIWTSRPAPLPFMRQALDDR